MAEYRKFFGVSVDLEKETAWLCEFLLGNKATDNIENLSVESIFEEEYSEYIEDSENWIPLEKFMDKWGSIYHWSEIGKIRANARLRSAMICSEDELFYVYEGDKFEKKEVV